MPFVISQTEKEDGVASHDPFKKVQTEVGTNTIPG
jgi:hypothetical protein